MTTEHPDIVLKNRNDLVWEPMVPELGPHSPRFATLRSDTRTGETTIVIEFPSAIHIPKHTHEKSETHFLLAGSHVFGHQGTRTEVREGGYFFMEGGIVHEAWAPAGAKAIIVLAGGWKVDWIGAGPTSADVGVQVPPSDSAADVARPKEYPWP